MSGLSIARWVGPSPEQWDVVIRGARNSWESWNKGDSRLWYRAQADTGGVFELGPADRVLALRLAALGADHGKYLRMLPVIVEVKAPGYWWREFDTYRVGVEASDVTQNSTSMMHTLGKEEISEALVYVADIPTNRRESLLATWEWLRQDWIEHGGKKKGPEATQWRALVAAIGYGWLYTRTVSLNYQVLRSIYHARRHHRLAEWRAWCAWSASLEHGELITGEEK